MLPKQEKLRKNVFTLGWISLLNDLGSETLTRLVPLYLTATLGAPMHLVGLVEGIADATSALLKPVFGTWSDRLKKRKPFIVLGYLLSAAARPVLAVAASWPVIAFLRFCDRTGKGIRTAPRNALISESVSQEKQGRGFGINRSMDTIGAVVGVLAFLSYTHRTGTHELSHEVWFWLVLACSGFGFAAVALASFAVKEPSEHATKKAIHAPFGSVFKRYLAVVFIFSLANSSDAFILLRAKELGFTLSQILGVVVLFNIVSSATALPASLLSDRVGRKLLILMGWGIFIAAYGCWAIAPEMNQFWFFAAVTAIYGLFYGFTESVELAWIADLTPAPARGRAYGVFGLVVGATTLPASLGFGWIWDSFGSQTAFLSSCALAALAGLLLLVFVGKEASQ